MLLNSVFDRFVQESPVAVMVRGLLEHVLTPASVDALFEELLTAIDEETAKRLQDAEISGFDPSRRGATWTYITTDQPFGSWMQSALRDLLKKKARGRELRQ